MTLEFIARERAAEILHEAEKDRSEKMSIMPRTDRIKWLFNDFFRRVEQIAGS